MTCSFVRLRSLLFVALFLGIGFISWGCASVGSPFVTSQTARGVKVSVTPASASVPGSGTKKFTASVVNTSAPAVIWQVNGTTGGEPTHGTIDTTGLYIAPPAVPSPSVVTIAAISKAQPTKMAIAQVGHAVKFTVPTVANGKVYLDTASEISVCGLSPN